jgi:hypothetical protein
MRFERAEWWAVSSALVLMAAGFFMVPSGGGDDVHITYWAAHALAHFGKIVNYNGEPLAQSSSLAVTVWLAMLNRVTSIPIPLLECLFRSGSGRFCGASGPSRHAPGRAHRAATRHHECVHLLEH